MNPELFKFSKTCSEKFRVKDKFDYLVKNLDVDYVQKHRTQFKILLDDYAATVEPNIDFYLAYLSMCGEKNVTILDRLPTKDLIELHYRRYDIDNLNWKILGRDYNPVKLELIMDNDWIMDKMKSLYDIHQESPEIFTKEHLRRINFEMFKKFDITKYPSYLNRLLTLEFAALYLDTKPDNLQSFISCATFRFYALEERHLLIIMDSSANSFIEQYFQKISNIDKISSETLLKALTMVKKRETVYNIETVLEKRVLSENTLCTPNTKISKI